MKWPRLLSYLLVFSLLLWVPAAGVDSGSGPKDSLCGKTMLVLGDSYTAGYGLSSPAQGWTALLTEACGMTELNYSISGSSFASGPQSYYPMVERCQDLAPNDDVDIVLLQGGSNDYARGIPVGTAEDRDPNTCGGALNLILDHLQQLYPQATIVCFTPWISDGTENALGLISHEYNDVMKAICSQRDILCYDAADTDTNAMYMDREDFRAEFCLRATDWYHLNAAGHQRFAPAMARWLSQTLYDAAAADCFIDLQTAGESLREAASIVVPAGLMDGNGVRMFRPSQSATRQTLALALYALANQPETEDYAFSDVPSDSPVYSAICYTVEAGILSGPEGFSPQQVLTRQMLATALYRCYTQLYGGQVDALTGLGSFPDGNQAGDYAKTALGWALECGVLSPKDGYLRPQGAVSRGELAITLAAFLGLIGEIS